MKITYVENKKENNPRKIILNADKIEFITNTKIMIYVDCPHIGTKAYTLLTKNILSIEQ